MTATDPDGVVHDLADDGTAVCGREAQSWSREVTWLQEAGLVLFCGECRPG